MKTTQWKETLHLLASNHCCYHEKKDKNRSDLAAGIETFHLNREANWSHSGGKVPPAVRVTVIWQGWPGIQPAGIWTPGGIMPPGGTTMVIIRGGGGGRGGADGGGRRCAGVGSGRNGGIGAWAMGIVGMEAFFTRRQIIGNKKNDTETFYFLATTVVWRRKSDLKPQNN